MSGTLVVGATGLVGSSFVAQYVSSSAITNAPLHILSRRPSGNVADGLTEHVASTEEWGRLIAEIAPDTVFCALGTTMKIAGSKQAFRAVDFELVDKVGTAAKAAATRHFLTVSSSMASSSASNFYLKTKGEAEDSLRAANFDRLDIIRPGLLKGERQGRARLGESIGIMFSPFLDLMLQGGLRKYRSIDSAVVARAVLALQNAPETGIFTHENDIITSLSDQWMRQN